MKAKVLLLSAVMILAMTGVAAAQAATATMDWDRNAEADMKDYQVWGCFTANCVVLKSAATQLGAPITQTAVGVRPSASIDLAGKEGTLAVSARDKTLNESGLSVSVPFDKAAPLTPTNPALR